MKMYGDIYNPVELQNHSRKIRIRLTDSFGWIRALRIRRLKNSRLFIGSRLFISSGLFINSGLFENGKSKNPIQGIKQGSKKDINVTSTGSKFASMSSEHLAEQTRKDDTRRRYLLERNLTNDDPKLRLRASQTLQQVECARTLNILSAQLSRETDPRVQSAMLRAMGTNLLSKPHFDKVVKFATYSSAAEVRLAAIDALAKQSQRNPNAKSKLQLLLKTEQTVKNRAAILQRLSSAKPKPA